MDLQLHIAENPYEALKMTIDVCTGYFPNPNQSEDLAPIKELQALVFIIDFIFFQTVFPTAI